MISFPLLKLTSPGTTGSYGYLHPIYLMAASLWVWINPWYPITSKTAFAVSPILQTTIIPNSTGLPSLSFTFNLFPLYWFDLSDIFVVFAKGCP